ncbi:MAG: hypothetical protein FWF46_04105 [Oscillospiraceae bacterium]|nr:hypothetical protein [Oscillospiraceae bacterium]
MTDTVLKKEGINLLIKGLGKVEMERFITMLLREPFDYTKWQENLLEDMTGEEINQKATEYYNKHNK